MDFTRLRPASRISSLLGALALLCLTTPLSGCQRSSHAAEAMPGHPPPGEVWLTPAQVRDGRIDVQPVDERSVDDAILTSGRVAFDDLRVGHVFSPVTGRVARIVAQLGQRVQTGEPLALIESPDIGSALSDERKAQADLIAADHDFNRQRTLFEQHATSAAVLEQSEDNWRKAKAELERSQQKTRLLRASHVNLVTQSYTLTAPVDGEVLVRNVSPGVEVQGQYGGGQAVELFTVGELDRVWVIADLYEVDLARVRVGAAAVVRVLAYPNRTFRGTVDWVSGMLDPMTRTARVRCTFDNFDHALKPEMYATVQISADERRTLAVPREAVLRLGEYHVAFVAVGDADGRTRFARVPVDVDDSESSDWLEVKHGLTRGQRIVTSGAIVLSRHL